MQDHTELGHAMLAGSGAELLDTASGSPGRTTSASTATATRCGLRRRADPAGRPDHRRRGHVRRDDHRPRVPARAARSRHAVEMLRAERGRQFDPRGRRRVPRRRSTQALRDPRALRRRRRRATRPPSGPEEDTQVTLQAAASALAISPSRLRRWADEGRIASIRTAGGHRRFPLAGRPAARRRARRAAERAADRAARRSRCRCSRSSSREHGRAGGGGRGRGDLPRRSAGLVRVRDAPGRTCATG